MITLNSNSLSSLFFNENHLPLKKSIPIALAFITGCGIAAYYYFSSYTEREKTSNSNYWANRKWIPQKVRDTVDPFLLSYDHPARKVLDQFYLKNNPNNLFLPGCKYISLGRRDIRAVLTNDELSQLGLIIKQPAIKGKTTLLNRVKGHRVANELIRDRNFTHVKVTQNWLYPLPGNGNIFNWSVHYLTHPVRLALKTLGLGCPYWLKYADRIFPERFVVVEEFVNTREPQNNHLEKCSIELVDEIIEVFLAVGFQDANDSNYCFDKKGKLILFDLEDYSHKRAKRLNNGKVGIHIMFRGDPRMEIIDQKTNDLIKISA